MTVKIEKSRAVGKAYAPPSKSFGHRALICGALTEGSAISNISPAESADIAATADCLKALGARITYEKGQLNIGMLNISDIPDNCELFCNESGSTLRFLIPICLLSGKRITLTGSNRLFERPLSVYENICREQGIEFIRKDSSITVCGRLQAGNFYIPGNISSQFISGLLFALPLLETDSTVCVTGKFESESYTDITLQVLSDFGVNIIREDSRFIIKGLQKYSSTSYLVEGDCSNAAFLEAFNCLDGNVSVLGLNPNTIQGDRAYKPLFEAVCNGVKEIDLTDCPDLAPVLFALAAAKNGAVFTGTARLKIKESDRASAMAEELAKFGIETVIGNNCVEICRGSLKPPTDLLKGHNDHRIVMSLAVLCTLTGGMIKGAEAIKKSFPDFFDRLKALKVGITEV